MTELPDDLREPLHSLRADLDWLVARIHTEDDEVASLCKDSIRTRLSHIEEASYRLAAGLAKSEADRASLVEAREAICRYNLHGAVRIIDAVLSAASGEARGDEVDRIPIPKAEFFAAVPRPAPSEAPNVEQVRQIAEHAGIDIDDYDLFIAELAEALDAARAGGIAAERERCKRIAKDGCLVPPDGGSPTSNEVDLCDCIAERIASGR